MFKPDPNDRLKIRRALAMIALIWSVMVLPVVLIAAHFLFSTSDTLCNAIMVHDGIIAAAPIGSYALGAHTQDKQDASIS